MATDPDLVAVLDRLDNHMSSWFGSSSSGHSFLGASKRSTTAGSATSNAEVFNSAVKNTTKSVQLLHSSFDEATRSLTHSLIRLGEIGAAVSFAVEGVLHLSRTYTQLADVGEMFGGSIFEMARQAGEAGLSLDEFAKTVVKHSAITALLGSNQLGSHNAFMSIQKSVRDSLDAVGFYGMTLSQLTDATGDYLDILRVTGRLTKTNELQARDGFNSLIGAISSFSNATGKSREEILKSVQEFTRDASNAIAMSNMSGAGADAMMKQFAFLSALPGQAGKFYANFLTEMNTPSKQIWQTPEYQAALNLGLTNVMDNLQKIASLRNVPGSQNEILRLMVENTEAIKNYHGQLTGTPTGDAALKTLQQSTDGLLEFVNHPEMLTELLNKLNQTAKPPDPITKALLTMESKFEMALGSAKDTFYGSMVSALFGSAGLTPEQRAARQKDMSPINKALDNLGFAVGNVLLSFETWLQTITPQDIEKFGNNVKAVSLALWDIAKYIGRFILWIDHKLQSLGMGPGGAAVTTGVILLAIKAAIPTFLGLMTQKVLGGGMGAGVGAAAGGARGGVGGFLSKMKGGFSIARGLYGLIAGFILDEMVDSMADGTAKSTLEGMIHSNAALLGGIGLMFGPEGAAIGFILGTIIDVIKNWGSIEWFFSEKGKPAREYLWKSIKDTWNSIWESISGWVMSFFPSKEDIKKMIEDAWQRVIHPNNSVTTPAAPSNGGVNQRPLDFGPVATPIPNSAPVTPQQYRTHLEELKAHSAEIQQRLDALSNQANSSGSTSKDTLQQIRDLMQQQTAIQAQIVIEQGKTTDATEALKPAGIQGPAH